ncbi:MAG: hypothetical protein GY850_05775, partial [bacterium]|nr:hypothetical protein [bacterium]
PKPLVPAAQGIMEGRKCSGRPRSPDSSVKNRFIEMVKASSDPDDPRFLFITCNARKVTSYHKWLQEDFQQKISLSALRRCVKKEKLQFYLNKPDFEDDQLPDTYFNPEPVFDLIQVDGCFFQEQKTAKNHRHVDIGNNGDQLRPDAVLTAFSAIHACQFLRLCQKSTIYRMSMASNK